VSVNALSRVTISQTTFIANITTQGSGIHIYLCKNRGESKVLDKLYIVYTEFFRLIAVKLLACFKIIRGTHMLRGH